MTITIYPGAPLRLTIDNKGAVPEQLHANFFDKFATAGKQGGTGLGTYSAKLLCEEITVDDLGLRSATIGYEILTRLGARYHRRYI